jgi:hypothetical protein
VSQGEAINQTAWGNRGSDRAKITGRAGRGFDIEFMGGGTARSCLSSSPDWEDDDWVTVVQTGGGEWMIVGPAGSAPKGNFAPVEGS